MTMKIKSFHNIISIHQLTYDMEIVKHLIVTIGYGQYIHYPLIKQTTEG